MRDTETARSRRFGRAISVRFSEPMVAQLHRAAGHREQRVSELVREAIREKLERIEENGGPPMR